MIKQATIADVIDIYNFIQPYDEEAQTGFGRPISKERTLQSLYTGVNGDGWVTLIEKDGDEIRGALIAYEGYSFYDTPEMNIDFFYISKKHRGSGASRKLVEEIIKIARERGVAVLYCGCHSYMADGGRNDKLFSNLFKRYGFEETGTNLHMGLL